MTGGYKDPLTNRWWERHQRLKVKYDIADKIRREAVNDLAVLHEKYNHLETAFFDYKIEKAQEIAKLKSELELVRAQLGTRIDRLQKETQNG